MYQVKPTNSIGKADRFFILHLNLLISKEIKNKNSKDAPIWNLFVQLWQRIILNHKNNLFATSINFTADFHLNLNVYVIGKHVSLRPLKIFAIYHKLR